MYGYLQVGLNVFGEKRKNYSIHRLVAETFIGLCPKGKEVSHQDDDPSNNALTNLKYETHRENMRRSIERGNHPCLNQKGEQHSQAKLKNSDIPVIRKLYAEGKRQKEIAEIYKVDRANISYIVCNHTWKGIC